MVLSPLSEALPSLGSPLSLSQAGKGFKADRTRA